MKAAKKVELLAPAGTAEAFYGAIHAGADAIYLGGSRFGARAYAENFSEEELVACIRYAHLFQRKVYLTVNTLVKESEFSGLYEYVLPYYRAGLDNHPIQSGPVICIALLPGRTGWGDYPGHGSVCISQRTFSRDGTPWKHSDDHYRGVWGSFSEGTGGLSCSSRQRAEPCGDPQDQGSHWA